MSNIQTIQQQRAKYALDKIIECKNEKNTNFHELAQFIVGMPNMILSNGIGQTMAYLLTKKDKQGQTFDMLSDWFINQHLLKDIDGKDRSKVLRKFSELSQSEYIRCQEEALRLTEWLKRYARALDEEKD